MKELIDRNKLLEDMPKNDELFPMDVHRVILEQPIVEAVPMDFHDRCMELEIKQRFAAEKRNREEHRAEGDDATGQLDGDLISREGIYNQIYDLACGCARVIDGICSDYANGLLEASNMIAEAMAVDALPVRHAYWIMHPYGAECSECKDTFRIQPTFQIAMPPKPWWRFCPSCGAKMDEKR